MQENQLEITQKYCSKWKALQLQIYSFVYTLFLVI